MVWLETRRRVGMGVRERVSELAEYVRFFILYHVVSRAIQRKAGELICVRSICVQLIRG